MNPHLRIVNAKTTTKPELIRLNAALAAENIELRNQVNDLADTLARKTAEPMLKRLFGPKHQEEDHFKQLNIQAKALATQLHAQTRIRNGTIEVLIHGGWNDIDTIAVPT